MKIDYHGRCKLTNAFSIRRAFGGMSGHFYASRWGSARRGYHDLTGSSGIGFHAAALQYCRDGRFRR